MRDSVLHVAGSLDATMSGPDLDPAEGLTSARRSLYFRSSKEKKVTFLEIFDSPNVTDCYRRSESVVVPKAERTRRLHKAFLRYHDPANWPLLREALQRMGRADLIGNGHRHLVPSFQPAGTGKAPACRTRRSPGTSPRTRSPAPRRRGGTWGRTAASPGPRRCAMSCPSHRRSG